MKCYNCDKDFNEEDLISTDSYGSWCEECMDKTPGDKSSGYCSESCRLFGECDDSC